MKFEKKEIKIVNKICPRCNSLFSVERKLNNGIEYVRKHEHKFCSQKCSNVRKFTDEQNKSKGRSGELNSGWKNGKTLEKHFCKKCGVNISFQSKLGYCIKCFKKTPEYREKLSISMKGNGGYRPGSGRAKTGYYKGIYCGSSWELAWVIYQIDHSIEFKRFDGILEYDGVKYIPDFLQNGDIVEIKGYEREEKVAIKTKVAEYHGYKVILKKKKDLQKEFDWCKENYTFKNLWELYDDYKPKYKFICKGCGIEFERDDNRSHLCCSKKCGGLYIANQKKIVKGMT